MPSTMRFVFVGPEAPQRPETNHPGPVSAAKVPAKPKSGHSGPRVIDTTLQWR